MWHIIKKHVKEIELRNNIAFTDTAWETFKQMESEIWQWLNQSDNSLPAWSSLTAYQKMLLKSASGKYGSSALAHEEDHMRDARELEELGLLTIQFDYRHGRSYSFYTTAKGRELEQRNRN
jgi:uncharacterized protein (DUF934 family)